MLTLGVFVCVFKGVIVEYYVPQGTILMVDAVMIRGAYMFGSGGQDGYYNFHTDAVNTILQETHLASLSWLTSDFLAKIGLADFNSDGPPDTKTAFIHQYLKHSVGLHLFSWISLINHGISANVGLWERETEGVSFIIVFATTNILPSVSHP